MNGRRYKRSSRSTLKIPSGNLQQSLHLAPPQLAPPSVTLTFPPPLTAPPPLFTTPPTPTPILTLQSTSTTSTPPHQAIPPTNYNLYPHSHSHHIPQATTPKKRQTATLTPHPQSPPQRPQPPRPSTYPRLPSCPRNLFQKDKTIRPDRHPKEKPTYTQSLHFH